MSNEDGDTRDIEDARAICARIANELRNLRQTLGIEHARGEDAGLSAAAGELQVIHAHVDHLESVLAAIAERDRS